MNKPAKFQKSDFKSRKKSYNFISYDEEALSLKEAKRTKEQKQYRNFENALRAKNVDALLEYEED
jgi:hypothetical protein